MEASGTDAKERELSNGDTSGRSGAMERVAARGKVRGAKVHKFLQLHTNGAHDSFERFKSNESR
jgi:hypothetical protein